MILASKIACFLLAEDYTRMGAAIGCTIIYSFFSICFGILCLLRSTNEGVRYRKGLRRIGIGLLVSALLSPGIMILFL